MSWLVRGGHRIQWTERTLINILNIHIIHIVHIIHKNPNKLCVLKLATCSVFLQNVINLLLSDLLTHPLHCICYILAANIARIINVKLLEDGPHFWACFFAIEKLSYVKGGSKELRVVYLSITTAVNLLNNIFYFFFR